MRAVPIRAAVRRVMDLRDAPRISDPDRELPIGDRGVRTDDPEEITSALVICLQRDRFGLVGRTEEPDHWFEPIVAPPRSV